ncbi:MAG: glycosyltransferase family 9 protein [Desulfovibrio sp.]|jgi:ADP-heptose:LPS heptosyltransferase|nr:glycosyltransferase family 9 protein [Desulfovibrio sp.]
MMPILVLQGARFGDLLQSKRLLLTLKSRGEVHLGVDKSLAPLAGSIYPGIEIHAFNFHVKPCRQALEENKKCLALWRDLDFRAVYNCNFSPLTAALCRCFEPERVFGYRPSAGGILCSSWVRAAFRLSERRRMTPLNLTDFWGHFAPAPLPAHKVNPLPRPGGQGLGVVLAGREARRSLPVSLLAEIVRCVFYALDGPRIRLLGTKAECPSARRLVRLLPSKMHRHIEDLSGKTDWPGLAGAVEGLDTLVTPDTGTMHLGAHLGVPVLAFFLSSAFCHETGPYGQGHHVWQAACACAPCLESAPCRAEIRCRKAFLSKNFLPALASLVEGKTLDHRLCCEDLQLWKSDLDELGGRFQLCAGVDEHDRQRGFLRCHLAKLSRLPLADSLREAGPDPAAAPSPEMGAWLYRDADWMLPPGRYC